MTRFFFLVLFFFATISSFAQPQKINSAELLKQGIELYQKDKYKEAIALYNKIPRSDTNYMEVLYYLSFVHSLDSNFEESKRYAEEGSKLYPEKNDEWWSLIANNLDDMGKRAEAITYYDKIIAAYHNAHLAWFNKGITYFRMNNLVEAKKALQQSAMINPYYPPVHFQLGKLAYQEGNMVAAMLSFATNLLVNPENKYSSSDITMLSAIAKMTDSAAKKAAMYKPGTQDNFDEIHEIVVSKIALDKQYKLKADLEDAIVRQLQVVFEKLQYNADDKGFWMQYYVPFYEKVLKEDQFEPMVYYMFSSVNVDDIQKYVKRNKKKMQDLAEWLVPYFSEIRATQTLVPADRKKVTEKVYYADGVVFGKGKMENEGMKNQALVGPWEFYYPNGALKSKGALDQKQEKTGEWEFYYANGKMKEKTMYKDGKSDGKSLTWFDNGSKLSEATYKGGDEEGKATTYYFNGAPRKLMNFKAGKKDGVETAYTSFFTLDYKQAYKDDKEEGEGTYYHKNGQIASTAKYKAGEVEGPFKKYYINGVLQMEGNVADGKRTGTWKEYYNNGKQKSVYGYALNEMDGDYKEYWDNGNLMTQATYVKGKIDGKWEDYDTDGKLYSESVYEKGRLRDLKFYDKSGKVISSSTSRNGAGNFTFYDADGNKTSEGYFTKDGLRDGKSTFYYRNGKVKYKSEYKNGLLNGERLSYFSNGALAAKNQYKDDQENGYQITYYINGNKRHEGEVVNGANEGLHIEYDYLGNAYSKSDYKQGDLDGYVEYYHPSGKKDYEQRYSSGWIMEVTEFDTTGKVLTTFEVGEDAKPFTFKNYAGNSYVQSTYKNHHLNGDHTTLFPNGKAYLTQYYKYGERDSTIKRYYTTGKLEYEGSYKMDERHGKWTYYYEEGQLYYTETYDNGKLNGILKLYNEDGTLDRELPYKNGDFDGAYKIYGDDNQLAVVIYYEDEKVQGYSYEDKTGKLVPVIPLKNGAGKLVAYYKNGTKSAEFDFDEDEVNGKRNLWFSNGKPYKEATRLVGNDDGLKKTYYKSGQLKEEENYLNGNQHGVVKTWWENGKIKSEEHWYNGDRHGVTKLYDNTGKLNQTLTYYFGSLQTIK